MKLQAVTPAVLLFLSSTQGFAPLSMNKSVKIAVPKSTITPNDSTNDDSSSRNTDDDNNRPLFDPLGLYPQQDRTTNGRFQPLEPILEPAGPVKDPLQLYSGLSTDEIDKTRFMSASVPFLERPPMLDGRSVPCDRGFDPFNFAYDKDALQWYRTAEIKHARLAMLAAVGWPVAELLDRKLAYLLHLKPLLVFQDRVPSVLNGGLDRVPGAYWAAALGVAFAIESLGVLRENSANDMGRDVTPGDLGFDPLGLAGKTKPERFYQMEAELFNGRLAMLAITSFALQEWWTSNSIVNQFPIFFKPINIALEQMQDMAGNAL
jgi:Chlorophyll A-B binding protein